MTGSQSNERFIGPFNGPIEIGLRTLAILGEAFPAAYSLQRLVIFDYLVVHSDDLPNGPAGLHPQTPHRGGELLVRRGSIQQGLLLFESRGLVERHFDDSGLLFSATEGSASFLDTLASPYVAELRSRAHWLVGSYGSTPQTDLESLVRSHIGEWGAEFELESVLWEEDGQ